jgi:toxin ParE1/3/4
VRFHDDARAEFAQEAMYYAAISPRLGARLVDAIEQAVGLAREFPGIGPPYRHGTRRVFPAKFPFSIVYLTRPSEIFVLAVAPFKRKPGYWRSRKGEA